MDNNHKREERKLEIIHALGADGRENFLDHISKNIHHAESTVERGAWIDALEYFDGGLERQHELVDVPFNEALAIIREMKQSREEEKIKEALEGVTALSESEEANQKTLLTARELLKDCSVSIGDESSKGEGDLLSELPKEDIMKIEKQETEILLKLGSIEIPKGITCALYAAGGIGKSLLIQREAMVRGIHTLHISGEDSSGQAAARLGGFKKWYEGKEIQSRLDYAGPETRTNSMEKVIEEIEGGEYELYIIDPLSAFCSGEWADVETHNAKAGELLALLNSLATKKGCTIIYTHHINQADIDGDIRTAARGSTALIDNARQGIILYDYSEEHRKPQRGVNRFQKHSQHQWYTAQALGHLTPWWTGVGKSVKKQGIDSTAQIKLVKILKAKCAKSNHTGPGIASLYAFMANEKEGGIDVAYIEDRGSLETIESAFIAGFTPPAGTTKTNNNNQNNGGQNNGDNQNVLTAVEVKG